MLPYIDITWRIFGPNFADFVSLVQGFSLYTHVTSILNRYALKQTILNIKLREFGSAWHKNTNILLFF